MYSWEKYIENYYNYSFFFWYVIISFILVTVLFFVSYLVATKDNTVEKSSPYECGFEAYDDSHKTFDLHFYIVGVLFLIFDLEVAFLFPWAVSLNAIGYFGFFMMIFFLFVLTIGFIYEWARGGLDWATQFDLKDFFK
jgi:NADH-quinone oxidoreductase subunit A